MRGRIALATVLSALALPASAGAFVIGGSAWPGHTITYFNAATGLDDAVALGARAWNTSGARIRFVAVPRSRAHVIFRTRVLSHSGVRDDSCGGHADVGHSKVLEHVDLEPGCAGRPVAAAVVAHELGHILGLDHAASGCAVMNPWVLQFCGDAPLPWQYRCRLVQPDDARGAIALYGGRVAAKSAFCDVFRGPGRPTGLRFSEDGRQLTWHNPPLPHPVSAEVAQPRLQASVVINRDVCPASGQFAQLVGLTIDALPGSDQTAEIPPGRVTGPGTWCVTVFVHDQFGRGAGTKAMLTIPQ
jgi:hypothetical protein